MTYLAQQGYYQAYAIRIATGLPQVVVGAQPEGTRLEVDYQRHFNGFATMARLVSGGKPHRSSLRIGNLVFDCQDFVLCIAIVRTARLVATIQTYYIQHAGRRRRASGSIQ